MTALPSLASAPWLNEPAVQNVFRLLSDNGGVVRVVGGAVRDGLMGREVNEVDFATTHVPDAVMAIAEGDGIKAIPTGIDHGTVTLAFDRRTFEVTTLREDIETDGRHAIVRFGTDWAADAARRDFTVNALSVDAEGQVHDPVGGYPDIEARRIRFIGDADTRIREDYLRILRFFRFHAECGVGPPDRAGLEAAIRNRDGLRTLAAERINNEMRRLLLAPGVISTFRAIEEAGLLQILLAGISHSGRLEQAIAIEDAARIASSYPRRLAVLAVMVSEDAARVADRLKLSNADRSALEAPFGIGADWSGTLSEMEAKEAVYRSGQEAFTDAAIHAASRGRGAPEKWVKLLQSLSGWLPPAFPLAGKDVLSTGIAKGPAVGALLKQLEKWWIAEGFTPDRATLLGRLQQIGASQQ